MVPGLDLGPEPVNIISIQAAYVATFSPHHHCCGGGKITVFTPAPAPNITFPHLCHIRARSGAAERGATAGAGGGMMVR